MAAKVTIRMMGLFTVEAADGIHEELMAKSRKGISLVQYLIFERGKPISSQRLIRELWSGSRNENPESALKTMVSRMRSMLSAISPELGNCIVSGQGTYRWQNQPGISVDALEIIDIFHALNKGVPDEEVLRKTDRLLDLFRGDLYLTGDFLGGQAIANWLHNEYLNAIYRMIRILKAVVSQRLVPTTDGSRVAVFEVMTVNPAIQNMIRDGRTHQIDNVIFGGNDKNMISMDAELQKLCREGKITRDSALLYAANPETLAKRI